MSPTDWQVDVSNKTGPSFGRLGGWRERWRKFVKGEGDGRATQMGGVQGWPVTRQVIITFPRSRSRETTLTTPNNERKWASDD